MTDTTQGDTAPVTKRVAEHFLLNATGAVVENEEEATGIRYKMLGVDAPFEYQTGLPAGDKNTMLACFGAKTLATNESSQVRNNPKGSGTVQEQMDAVIERFLTIEGGKWVDRTRDGVGARVDKDKLTSALCAVLVAGGKKTAEEAADGSPFWLERRAKLEADKGFQATVRNVPGVNEAYARLVGRITKTVDDLLT